MVLAKQGWILLARCCRMMLGEILLKLTSLSDRGELIKVESIYNQYKSLVDQYYMYVLIDKWHTYNLCPSHLPGLSYYTFFKSILSRFRRS